MAERHAWIVGNTDGIGRALTTRLLGAGWRVTGISRRAAEPSLSSTLSYEHLVSDVRAPDYRERLSMNGNARLWQRIQAAHHTLVWL